MKEMNPCSEIKIGQVGWLLITMIIYCSANLLHFVHNGVFIDEYPNLPDWISSIGVYITWFGITSIGVAGYLLFYRGKRFIGLVTCAVYGAMGLDGFGHYSLAPISAHTFTMNFTIWLEAITGLIVVFFVTALMVKHVNGRYQTALE